MVSLKGKTIMASAPDPQHHNPDAWQAIGWAAQQGWVLIVGLVFWLFNQLYTLLFAKRNAEVDARLAAQDEKLDELIGLVTSLRIEIAKLQGQHPPKS